MTTHTPLRCANSFMVARGANEIVLMDTGAYPGVSNFLNQTWTFNGTDWTNTGTTLIDANGPLPGRINHVMAYDGFRVILYGGQGESSLRGALQDTWSFDAPGVWTRETPTTSPFGRYFAEACRLNNGSNFVVMFGGFGGAGSGVFLNETWRWSGITRNWTLQTPTTSPAARIGHVMAGGNAVTLMFGGQGTNQIFNDTWTYDGTDWTRLSPATSPSCRTGASMAFDITNSQWVMFGGMDYYNRLPETWCFDGTTWTKKAPAHSPPGLTFAQMSWEPTTNKIILFGGYSATDNYASDKTWSWNGTDWTQL